jgi:RNA polymerase sigma factor for flagellar operon FliA
MRVPTATIADRDDIVSAAMLGLIDAVDRFEPGRGVPFEAYASLRIRGAVVDELRRVDERGRSDRRREETAIAISLDELLAADSHWLPVAEDELDDRYDREDLSHRVQTALDRLPARQREVIARYYGDALTLREAGIRMGISEARACQLHGRAIHNLRRELAVTVAPRRVVPPRRVAPLPAVAA